MDLLLIAEQLRRVVPGGIGTYIRGLVQGLEAIDSDDLNVTLFASRTRQRPDPLDALGLPLRTSPLPGPLLTRAWDRRRSPVRGSFDVVHAASLAAPPTTRPLSVLVHDLAWRDVPEAFPPRGRRWHEVALARALAKAQLLVTPSTATADALVAAGAVAGRVEVVEEGCDHLPPADTAAAARVLSGLGIDGPFLLTVGTVEPRKNLVRLLAAYEEARRKLPDPWPLLVVGPPGWGQTVHPPQGAVLAGHVSDPVLAGLYASARCLVYVPLQEGFGLPAVEGMAACLPVVASPMPSVADAGLQVDPLDVAAIADAIVQASTDERLRSELVTAGLLRAEELTWAVAAKRHAELWRALLR
jgi:glycosyltransferase involved in cell wall biosynthesis